MAKSIKLSEKKIWIGFRHSNGTLVVQGFEDILESDDFENFYMKEPAGQRAQGIINVTPGAKVLTGATKAEHAIELAGQMGI